jgi:hypothetical protein
MVLFDASRVTRRGNLHFGLPKTDLHFYLNRENLRDSSITFGPSIERKLGPFGKFLPSRLSFSEVFPEEDSSLEFDLANTTEIENLSITEGGEFISTPPKTITFFNHQAVADFGNLREKPYLPSDLNFFLREISTSDDPIIWGFICPPQTVEEQITSDINIAATPTTTGRSVVYGGRSMKKISLNDILVEGLSTQTNLTRHLQRLRDLTSGPIIFEFFNATSQSERSYGSYILTSLSIREILRTRNGDPLRAEVSFDLQEVPKWQIDAKTDRQFNDEKAEVDLPKSVKELTESSNDKAWYGTMRKDVARWFAELRAKQLSRNSEVLQERKKALRGQPNRYLSFIEEGVNQYLKDKNVEENFRNATSFEIATGYNVESQF